MPNQFGEIKEGSIPCTCYFSGLQLVNIYAQNDTFSEIYDVLTNITSMVQIIAQQYKLISYIGPLREAPARKYIFDNEIVDIGIRGENAPYIFATEDYLTKRANIIYESDKLDIRRMDRSFREQVVMWLKYLGIQNLRLGNNDEIISLHIDNDNIADVGFGVSQALPIIIEGVRLNKDSMLILEQPEIHLHPKMQMRIADFFIVMALSGKQLIIETHSDHMINRIVRRIMEDERNNLSNLINIYFVSQQDRESMIEKIKIDKIKGIISWPEDFFDQYATETESIIQVGFENLIKKNTKDR
ncbi:DUF3696 domain-containing protein [Sporomusa sp. GT1]|uniref:AAA family ATPase n=1 Tax=Sporomusa sp. GT1 TaxID=1534747 RepID=UPI001CB8564C|nr:DUF3696 domain-containing protein [Sporomusa sp. GT1]